MKKFIVNSGILPLQIDTVSCNTAIPKMLMGAGYKNIKIKTCYCCNQDRKVVFEVDADNKDALSEALNKIEFPVESIMETEKK